MELINKIMFYIGNSYIYIYILYIGWVSFYEINYKWYVQNIKIAYVQLRKSTVLIRFNKEMTLVFECKVLIESLLESAVVLFVPLRPHLHGK